MANVWIITRHIDDAKASSINVDELLITDARTYEIMMVKSGLDKLGANTKFIKISDLSPENIKNIKSTLPDIAIVRCNMWDSELETKILEELEYQGVLVINSSKSHFICNDKLLQHDHLNCFGIRTPKSMMLPRNVDIELLPTIEEFLGLPIVIKPRTGTSGILTVKCNNTEEIKNAWSDIAGHRYYKNALAQKWIDHEPYGMINALVIGGEIVSCFQRIPNTKIDFWNTGAIVFDQLSQLSEDKKIKTIKEKIAGSDPTKDLYDITKPRPKNDLRDEYPISNELKTFCKATCDAIYGIDIVRIDILKDSEGYMICEVNSPAGYPAHDMFMGKDCGLLMAKYALEKL
jgi:glutathione synthase/RimK-type ligase-like ATP-grasp enzyme